MLIKILHCIVPNLSHYWWKTMCASRIIHTDLELMLCWLEGIPCDETVKNPVNRHKYYVWWRQIKLIYVPVMKCSPCHVNDHKTPWTYVRSWWDMTRKAVRGGYSVEAVLQTPLLSIMWHCLLKLILRTRAHMYCKLWPTSPPPLTSCLRINHSPSLFLPHCQSPSCFYVSKWCKNLSLKA